MALQTVEVCFVFQPWTKHRTPTRAGRGPAGGRAGGGGGGAGGLAMTAPRAKAWEESITGAAKPKACLGVK